MSDAVHEAAAGRSRHRPRGAPGDLLDPHRAADLAVAGAGLARRPVRPARPRRLRRRVERASWVLSAYATNVTTLYVTYGGSGGIGTGNRLYRHRRVDGALVPDRPRLRRRHGRRRLRHRRHRHQLPIDGMIKSAGYQHTMIVFGCNSRRHRRSAALGLRRPPVDLASASRRARRRHRTPQLRAARSAADANLLAALRHDDDDVDRRPHGGLAVRRLRQGVRVSEMLVFGMAAVPLALTVDRFTNGLTRPFFAGCRTISGVEHDGIAFLLEAAAIALMLISAPIRWPSCAVGPRLLRLGRDLLAVPVTLTDTFGTAQATTNMASSTWRRASARCSAAGRRVPYGMAAAGCRSSPW